MASSLQQLKAPESGGGGGRAAQAEAVRETGKGKSRSRSSSSSGRRKVTYGFHLVEGRMPHGMEDRHVAEFRQLDVATYLRDHLFDSILSTNRTWTEPMEAVRRAYHRTDGKVLKTDKADGGGEGRRRRGGSTAVTVILVNGETLVVANVGDSRAVLCDAGGRARQLSVDNEPLQERRAIEGRGGFVTEIHARHDPVTQETWLAWTRSWPYRARSGTVRSRSTSARTRTWRWRTSARARSCWCWPATGCGR
ncbi:hypothetical protein BS78_02G293100 [Paspalum vaginatum]|nr:hypothetical protein BS78_02G293100 [Paspalum vaginatum]